MRMYNLHAAMFIEHLEYARYSCVTLRYVSAHRKQMSLTLWS